jgi:hypothetical protein
VSFAWFDGVSLTAEAALLAATGSYGVWDSSLWDTGTWGPDVAWVDISAYLRSLSTSRRFSRDIQVWEAGTAQAVLDDRDGRFSPSNMSSPYVTGGVTGIRPWRPVRYRATYAGVTYDLYRGYVQSWQESWTPGHADAEVTISCADELARLAAFDGLEQAPVGAGETSGRRIHRILDNAGHVGERSVDDGRTTMQATTLSGDAVAELKVTTDSEGGALWIDADGSVDFDHGYALIENTRSNTVMATFADTPGSDISDTFTRTVASGWSTADAGGIWTTTADCSVTGTAGRHSLTSVNVSRRSSIGQATSDVLDMRARVRTDALAATQPIYGALCGRFVDASNMYMGQVRFTAAAQLEARIVARVAGFETTVGSVVVPGVPHVAGSWYRVRFQIIGSALRLKVWPDGSSEPDAWHVDVTDTTLTTSAPVGFRSILVTGNTNALPVAVEFDDLTVATPMPYSDATVEYNGDLLANIAAFARVGGTAQVASDLTSRALYGDRRTSRADLMCEADAQAGALAQLWVARFKDPELRVTQIKVKPRADPARLFPQVLGRKVRDLVRVVVRPLGGYTITRDCFISGISHDITEDDWITTFDLSSAVPFTQFTTSRFDVGVWDSATWFY